MSLSIWSIENSYFHTSNTKGTVGQEVRGNKDAKVVIIVIFLANLETYVHILGSGVWGAHTLLERTLSVGSVMMCQTYTAPKGAQSTVSRLSVPFGLDHGFPHPESQSGQTAGGSH